MKVKRLEPKATAKASKCSGLSDYPVCATAVVVATAAGWY